MSVWKSYKQLVKKKFLFPRYSENDGLPYWREKLFQTILLILAPVGIGLYIPSIIFSVKSGAWIIGIYDTIAVIIVLLLVFNNSINLRIKKYLLLSNFYFLAIILLFFLGEKGPGAVFLIAISTLSVLILSTRAGYITLIINTVIYFALAANSFSPDFLIPSHFDYSVSEWVTIAVNFIGINALITLSIPILIDGLDNYIRKEKELREQLIAKTHKLQIEKEKAVLAEKEISRYKAGLEKLVKERTHELEEKNKELENYNQLFVGREFRIKELKEKIKNLENR